MESFASKSSSWRYFAACLITCAGLACASDDSDSNQEEESQSTKESDAKNTKDAKDSDAKDTKPEDAEDAEDKGAKDEQAVDNSPEAAAKRDEAANPGSAAVTRFDGNWKGTTSQDTPVSFKILNRFLAHMEVDYKLEGDGCSQEGSVKLSAMNPSRMGAFMLMTTTDKETLTISGKFDSDNESSGNYSVEYKGEAPKGCNSSVSGTWKATK